MQYRSAPRDIAQTIVLERQDRKTDLTHIAKWAEKTIAQQDRQPFSEMVENESLNLHAGIFARHQVKPS
ncbi:hypothetical protein G8764_21680 [Pseudomaricurvus alcaniphilus]|uniref:hypothetical protein n=1 Tax=Pseudomaricurvus alcaniphilus TaxID=1166482 RepID=UPI00140DCE2F|nr:hypothetical protein [Pseudomaricurvus alcaniphilus]NHN39917.1 hypothetical protein [Pseudomaricurvus alcaniphilus]